MSHHIPHHIIPQNDAEDDDISWRILQPDRKQGVFSSRAHVHPSRISRLRMFFDLDHFIFMWATLVDHGPLVKNPSSYASFPLGSCSFSKTKRGTWPGSKGHWAWHTAPSLGRRAYFARCQTPLEQGLLGGSSSLQTLIFFSPSSFQVAIQIVPLHSISFFLLHFSQCKASQQKTQSYFFSSAVHRSGCVGGFWRAADWRL